VHIALAATLHDPEGRLHDQLVRLLPVLNTVFSGLTLSVTPDSDQRAVELLRASGAMIERRSEPPSAGSAKIGRARRAAVALALEYSTPFVMYCDFDRVLHWTEYHVPELAEVLNTLTAYDFTILGRTLRAFESHPRVQRDTESIINHVFAVVSGSAWDVTAAARGLSRQAAEAIVGGCADDNISTDVSWPLFVRQKTGLSIGYVQTEGLEFETADRYADEVERAGGVAAWIAQIDADPNQWAQRLELARAEVEGMRPYAKRRL
jgi:hypothetical protein